MILRVAILVLSSFATDLASADEMRLPETTSGQPRAGARVAVTIDEYADSDIHHMLYLPGDWTESNATDRRWPVIVEYTGNHFPAACSTGKVEDAGLGYGLSQGRFIWVTLPFVSTDHQQNATTWWGDVEATVGYARRVVPAICSQYHGDPEAVFLCGFSRGAIAVNFIGLHDDEIAELWAGFITHDHYDGVRGWKNTEWGWPVEDYQSAATKRLQRIGGRPVLVCQNGSTDQIAAYLKARGVVTNVTFLDINMRSLFPTIPNELVCHVHNDRWPLVESSYQERVSAWFDKNLPNRAIPVSN